MVKLEIKKPETVLMEGIEFAGDVCFSGEYGQQVCNKETQDGGYPLTGLVYEKNKKGNIIYYAFYEDGVQNGDCVSFYESGKIKEMSRMKAGCKWGESVVLHENGNIKRIEECQYGIILKYKDFDVEGNVIKEKKAPNQTEIKLLEKLRRVYGKK